MWISFSKENIVKIPTNIVGVVETSPVQLGKMLWIENILKFKRAVSLVISNSKFQPARFRDVGLDRCPRNVWLFWFKPFII